MPKTITKKNKEVFIIGILVGIVTFVGTLLLLLGLTGIIFSYVTYIQVAALGGVVVLIPLLLLFYTRTRNNVLYRHMRYYFVVAVLTAIVTFGATYYMGLLYNYTCLAPCKIT